MSQKNRKLGRTSDQRRAMLRAMVTYLLENGQIKTTITRAKEVAPVAEKMITLAKKNDLASYRQALGFITKEDVAKKLFQELGPKYAERNGGYTRVVRIGPRRGEIPAHQGRDFFAAAGKPVHGQSPFSEKRGPRASPAAAQPLAALPPYGCGVPLAGKWVAWGEEEKRNE